MRERRSVHEPAISGSLNSLRRPNPLFIRGVYGAAMAEVSGKVEKAFEEWRRAEERYAEALAAFGQAGPPAKVKKDVAVDLAKLRSRADAARDAYFKRALK